MYIVRLNISNANDKYLHLLFFPLRFLKHTREELSHNKYLENYLSFCTNNYLDISSKNPQCEKLHRSWVRELSFHSDSIIIAVYIFTDFRLLRHYLNERKIRFYRNSNIRKPGISIYISPNVPIEMHPARITLASTKSRSRKGFRCCGRSFAAEFRTKPRRRIMGQMDVKTQGSINGSQPSMRFGEK